MAQRISRAKQRIKASGAEFRMPAAAERAERMAAVLHVLYLIFNEGYTASSGSALHRVELTTEAIRLTRQLHERLPDDGEVAGLLALMLLTDARRPARTGPDGALVPLAEQDRSRGTPARSPRATALITETLAARADRPVPAAGGHRRRARRGSPAPRTPTGPRSSASTSCWTALAPGPDGHPQPDRRGRDGPRPAGRPGAARRGRGRPRPRRAPPGGRRPRTPARARRRPRGRPRAPTGGRPPDPQPARAALPRVPRRPPRSP